VRGLALVALMTACGEEPCPEGSSRQDDGLCHLDDEDDTAGGGQDTALDTEHELSTVPFTACADPSTRESEGPYEALTGGDAWQSEAVYDNFEEVYTGYGLAVADLDADGVLDVFLPNRGTDQLFLGVGDGSFTDASDQLPQDAAPSTAATAVDADGDGDLDLFISRLSEHNELWLNDGGGTFSASPERDWLEVATRTTMGSSWHDVDGDGDLDPLVNHLSNWEPSWMETEPTSGLDDWPLDILFWNQGDAAFTSATELPADLGSGFTFAAMWFDHSGVGSPGVYVANDYRVEFDWIQSNRAFAWSDGAFEEISDTTGAGLTSETMGLSVNDVNGDGQADLAMSARGKVHLLLSDEVGWYDVSATAGLSWSSTEPDFNAWGVDLEDVDNDGDLDMALGMGLLMADLPWDETLTAEVLEGDGTFFYNPVKQADMLYLQDDSASFEDVAAAWGIDDTMVTRGVILADLDGDGWLDLLKRQMAGPPVIYKARCGEAAAVTVRLAGTQPNPYGVGARIEVEAGGVTQTRWIHAGESLSSSAPYMAHVGLADATTIDRLTITWSDGTVAAFEDLDVNEHIEVRHPQGASRLPFGG